jgi:hypothetical protein
MQPIVIRYNTKPEGAQPNAQLIENVFVELERAQPANVRYLVLRLSDGVFIHIVAYDGEPEGLTGLPAFVRFQAEAGPFRANEPVRCDAEIVGNYRMLAATN